MDRLGWSGVGLALLGVVGYVAGIAIEYPGRAFSVTAVMVGFTLAAIAKPLAAREPAADATEGPR